MRHRGFFWEFTVFLGTAFPVLTTISFGSLKRTLEVMFWASVVCLIIAFNTGGF